MLKRIRKLLDRRKRPADEISTPSSTTDPEPARGPDADSQPAVAISRTIGDPPVHEGPRVVHRPIAVSDLDPEAVKIVRRLSRFDHQAYLVGGCVRDLLLERKPKDFDVGTSATPRQIKRVFRNCRVIGRRFRLAHIYFQDGKIIEVATFRARDGFEETDEAPRDDLLIRDDNVFGTPEEDALRRDFTINALFYDVNDETVLDHTDGLSDLRRRLVRTIGDPDIRFREDPIRVLRAIKFAARLGFEIEPGTLAALRRTRSDIRKAAPPRVLEEINRFCREGAARRSFELLRETEVLDVILPEIADHARGRSWEIVLALLERMDAKSATREREIRTGTIFSALLLPLVAERFGWTGPATREVGPDDAQDVLDELLRPIALRLRVPRREQEYCRQLLSTLVRMVPSDGAKRTSRSSTLARECRDDAVWFIEVLGAELRGELATSASAWASSLAKEVGEGTEAPASRGRRRGRRGGRRRRKPEIGAEAAAEATRPALTGDSHGGAGERAPRSEPKPHARRARGGGSTGFATGSEKRPEKRDLPPVWSDDYFFAALPSAPEEGASSQPEREKIANETELGTTSREAEPPTGAPRRRRSRRRRRKSAVPAAGEPAAAETETDGGDGGEDTRDDDQAELAPPDGDDWTRTQPE